MSGDRVRMSVTDDLRRSRLTVFFRLLLALPHLAWLVLWTIAAVFGALASWFAALARGRVPGPLHQFLAAFVRYATHVGAFLTLAANPYPGFTGRSGYPVDVEIPEPRRQRRAGVALRLVVALPALLVAGAVGTGVAAGGTRAEGGDSRLVTGGAAAVCGVLGWFASLATGRMPPGLRDLAAYGLGYNAQAASYLLLLTDRYPNADPEQTGPAWSLPPHPVRLELTDDGRRSRLTALFRLLLALPHLAWLALWTLAAVLAAIANTVVALLRGRSADALHRFLVAYVRYTAQVSAFSFLVANPFPGFSGTPGYPVDISLGDAVAQRRWITLFRGALVLPALFVAAALAVALVLVGVLGWFASLARGRMPGGLRNLGAISVRYLAQTNAYLLIVTDRYPYASPALRPPPIPEVEA